MNFILLSNLLMIVGCFQRIVFFHRHRIVEDSGRVVGYKNLDELREEFKPILLRWTKESVQIDLPERTVEGNCLFLLTPKPRNKSSLPYF
jgi:hypothetical protein